MPKLEKCPFCGGEPKLIYCNDAYIVCETCNLRGPGGFYSRLTNIAEYIDVEHCIKQWNLFCKECGNGRKKKRNSTKAT